MTIASFTNARGKPNGTVTPRPQQTQVENLPAPVGMNTMVPIASLGSDDCIYTYNLMPFELGLRTRQGYVEWANSFTGGGSVRTIIPFHGNNPVNDRLFALTDQGIFDISSQGTDGVSPTQVFTWTNPGGDAGYATYTHFTNDANVHYILIADERNGYHYWEEGGAGWTKVPDGSLTGGPADLATTTRFVVAHKNRIWFIREGETSAYYLPTNAFTGAVTRFNFGGNFREGGFLAGLFSWTVDGGDGVDDYMVGVSREGAVVVYRGGDPANASTWALVGTWYVGQVVAGRRVGSQYGGTLFIICELGLVNINKLLEGRSVEEASLAATGKITRLVREEFQRTGTQRGWEIISLPQESTWIVNAPSDNTEISYVANQTTKGWGLWRGLPLHTGDVFNGRLYFADLNGSVYVHSGALDNVRLDGSPGVAIEFSMLTSFQGGGPFKRAQFCRPIFLSEGLPSYAVQARFDFNLDENDKPIIFQLSDVSAWDSSLWDSAVWAGGVSSAQAIRGLSGYGHYMAIALKGQTSSRVTLVNLEVQFESGGLL